VVYPCNERYRDRNAVVYGMLVEVSNVHATQKETVDEVKTKKEDQ
jgi:hypothetical protein